MLTVRIASTTKVINSSQLCKRVLVTNVPSRLEKVFKRQLKARIQLDSIVVRIQIITQTLFQGSIELGFVSDVQGIIIESLCSLCMFHKNPSRFINYGMNTYCMLSQVSKDEMIM